jgi:hypothetical protein
LQLGLTSSANNIQWLLLASPNQDNEYQQSPQAAQSSSLEMERGGRGRHRENEGGAADSPLRKHWKVDCQVDRAGFTRWQSTQDCHLTTKATKDR